jgi:hypothetical protein
MKMNIHMMAKDAHDYKQIIILIIIMQLQLPIWLYVAGIQIKNRYIYTSCMKVDAILG